MEHFNRMRIFVMAIAGCLSFGAFAEDAASRLSTARSLKCQFGPGTSTVWSAGNPKTSDARFDADVTFDIIDLKRGSVRVIGNIGAGDARVTLSPVGMSIVEMNPGVVDVTTVFSVYDKAGDFIAVDTRHVKAFGATMVEQYFGTCKVSK